MSELATKAIRVHLFWAYWQPGKTDKTITDQTNAAYKVVAGSGKYDKRLFSPLFMKGLTEHTSQTKAWYYKHTLPWEDKVSRLVSTERLEETLVYLNQQVEKYERILRETVGDEDQYTQSVYDQRVYIGAAWDAKDYPTREVFMGKYWGKVYVLPLVSSSDIRCELSESLRAQIAADVERDTEERYAAAMKNCWDRLYEPVRKMADTLAQKNAVFRDSLVKNVRDVAEVMPDLNILGDTRLTVLAQQLIDRLDVDPDALRQDEGTRVEYAQRASELADILSRMGVS